MYGDPNRTSFELHANFDLGVWACHRALGGTVRGRSANDRRTPRESGPACFPGPTVTASKMKRTDSGTAVIGAESQRLSRIGRYL